MRKLVLLSVLVFCPAGLAVAQQAATMNQGQMDALDRNKDGAVDRSEYEAFMTTAFANLDKNKDGNLTPDETKQALNAQQFAATDANSDGKITRAEFLDRVMADFKTADRSGDGNLK
ncbi:EF-hand domain-containing protein [Ensifer adhaerens]|uniref:EF-hand domain-containing protein n=1 Tax=Ensifer adhaerens TaxID=106592 RepID=UPI001CBDEFFE|nr:EF-hand domain-containing protein [Ensifer adhaerens]MBZ7920298.1 EF-hand domain-containing protein [Ensifer adhaerens]UAX92790.1 EF-hand domain-containing protein [Ensifer adhaerens]UAY00425.1 EF-hand domain-containing protein [Ensifer adhaerens]UAY07807.1 EF-hand domain-containing protein [Ensifer adhaerens]